MELLNITNAGIYQITNLRNNKVYIGSTTNFKIRSRAHINLLKRNKHFNTHLQAAFNKYGEESFEISIVEILHISNAKSKEDFVQTLLNREEYYIQKIKASNPEFGYNARYTCNSNLGKKFTQQQKLNLSKAKQGIPMHPNTKKVLIQYSQARKGKPNKDFLKWYTSLSQEELHKFKATINKNLDKGREEGKRRLKETGCYWTQKSLLAIKEHRGHKINCFSKDGKLLCTYLSVADALRGIGKNPKSTCCITDNIKKKCYYEEYYFEYYIEGKTFLTKEEILQIIHNTNEKTLYKKVLQYDSNYQLIKKFDTITQAAKSVGLTKSTHLRNAILANKYYKGFYWKYFELTYSDICVE